MGRRFLRCFRSRFAASTHKRSNYRKSGSRSHGCRARGAESCLTQQMKVPTFRLRLALLAGLAGALGVVIATDDSKPSRRVINQGIEQNVRIQAARMNPYVVGAEAMITAQRIIRSYPSGEAVIYEYEAAVTLADGASWENARTATITGKERFWKDQGRWRFDEVEWKGTVAH